MCIWPILGHLASRIWPSKSPMCAMGRCQMGRCEILGYPAFSLLYFWMYLLYYSCWAPPFAWFRVSGPSTYVPWFGQIWHLGLHLGAMLKSGPATAAFLVPKRLLFSFQPKLCTAFAFLIEKIHFQSGIKPIFFLNVVSCGSHAMVWADLASI